MNVAGIIAEYNPFHNGHLYHLNEIRKCTGADYVVVVMSGDYTQRGNPAILDKHTRAEMALSCGADLVLELPVIYATASAEHFAMGSIAMLDKLGVVTHLGFGSESGDLESLTKIASVLASEPASYSRSLKQYLKEGYSFPSARAHALFDQVQEDGIINHSSLLLPNNILGIEYVKALQLRKSTIQPCTIARVGSGYHDTQLNDGYSSATAIRHLINASPSPEGLVGHIPPEIFTILAENRHKYLPIYPNDFSSILYYQLMTHHKHGYQRFHDVSSALSDKICNNLIDYSSFEQFTDILKSRDLTYTRISRSLLHILLNITKHTLAEAKEDDYILYANMLGFKKNATPLLKQIKSNSTIPLLSKLADAPNLLNDKGISLLQHDEWCSQLYDGVRSMKYQVPSIHERSKEIVVVR